MIRVEQPAISVVSHDFMNYIPSMACNLVVPAGQSIDVTLAKIVKEAKDLPGGKVRFLFVLCHGIYGTAPGATKLSGGFGLALGAGVQRTDLPKFRILRGVVESIWLGASGPARQTNAGATGERLGGDGAMFCSEMARATEAYVAAATSVQIRSANLPYGCIDDYKGGVVQFGPLGNIVWQHDYGRTLLEWLKYPSN